MDSATQYYDPERVWRSTGNLPFFIPTGREYAAGKAQNFLDLLTLEEKAWLVTGVPEPCTGNIGSIPRLNFTGLCLQDGPNAMGASDFVGVFSSGLTIA